METDMMRIGMWMLRNDGTDIPDTVATALFDSYETQSAYSQLIIDVEYRNEFDPEILNIMAVSSHPDNPVAESVLYIDKIELDYNTGIISNYNSELSVFPCPGINYISLNKIFINCKYQIFDVQGKKTTEGIFVDLIDISNLDLGTYFISVEYKGLLHTQKFIKQ
ncbi:MAG: T9SS type A sorting domain-containing protein [Bacteroidales bacterium]|nr:T9SS type A sorting domain-containing protein [Bacteroidales bacterium]